MKRLKDFEVIKNSNEFSRLYKTSGKYFSNSVVIFYKACDEKKVGFTASKKIGNAVKRNFAKRRLRALFMEIQKDLKNGIYIFVAKQKILNIDYKDFKRGILFSLKKLQALSFK